MPIVILIFCLVRAAWAEGVVGVPGAIATPAPAEQDSGTIYSPIGKRDPFRALAMTNLDRALTGLNALERFSLEQFQLRAVLRGLGKPRAMFEDPDGKSYILTEGDSIGREHATISRIVNSEVIVTQRTFNYLGAESLLEKVISLPKDGEFDDGAKGKGPDGRRNAAAAQDLGPGGPVTAPANMLEGALNNLQQNLGVNPPAAPPPNGVGGVGKPDVGGPHP
jgi:type IV pilus assembly protein PilP